MGKGTRHDRTSDFSQRGVPGGCCRPGRLVDVEGDPLGVTGPLLPRDNQEYRSPSEDSGLGADMPRTRSTASSIFNAGRTAIRHFAIDAQWFLRVRKRSYKFPSYYTSPGSVGKKFSRKLRMKWRDAGWKMAAAVLPALISTKPPPSLFPLQFSC